MNAVGQERGVAASKEVVKALFLADGDVRGVVRRDRQETTARNSPFRKWRCADFAEARRVDRDEFTVEEVLVSRGETMVGAGIGIALPLLERRELLGLLICLRNFHVLQGKSNLAQMRCGRDDIEEIRHLIAG